MLQQETEKTRPASSWAFGAFGTLVVGLVVESSGSWAGDPYDPLIVQPARLRDYFDIPPALLHVFEMCLTELTSMVGSLEDIALVEVAVPALSVPVILTSWPTCSANFAVSPVSSYIFPWLLVSMYFPFALLRQPRTLVCEPVLVVVGVSLFVWAGVFCATAQEPPSSSTESISMNRIGNLHN
jgi:hypothetical protein